MAKRRNTSKGSRSSGNGAAHLLAAYQSAMAQVVYDEAYEAIRQDPRRMELIRRFLRDMAATFADKTDP